MASNAFGQAVHRLPVQRQFVQWLDAHALRRVLQQFPGHDFVGALAHLAERRRIGHAVVHVQRQQAANLRRFLMASQLFGDKGLFRTRAALVLKFFHVEGHRVDQVVGELPVTYPGIAQQVEPGLLRLQVAQVMDGIEVRQARVVQQVLLRDAELGQQRLGDPVQGLQRGALLALPCHLTPAEIFSVLLERCQLRQGV